MSEAALNGFLLGAGLIIAIGAQNLFVLRQGLKRAHVFAVALACSLIDTGLIALGAGGVGTLVAQSPGLTRFAAWGGAAFLLAYAARALASALRPAHDPDPELPSAGGRAGVLGAAAAVSLLNPHVYLDTVVLVGGLAAQYQGLDRLGFGAGAALASFAWFFALAYGARLASPLLRGQNGQRALDLFAALVMAAIAAGLIHDQLSG